MERLSELGRQQITISLPCMHDCRFILLLEATTIKEETA